LVEEKVRKPEKEEKKKVTIIRRREVVTYPKLKQPVTNVMVTYVYGTLPPSTVTIPKEEWSKDKEAVVIREDIKKREEFQVEEIEV